MMTNSDHKDIGKQELVFATVTKITPTPTMVIVTFEHATTGREIKHLITPDKLKFRNIYKDLEVGCTYIIVETLEAKKRWVWTSCRLCTKTQARAVFKKTGITPEYEDMKKAMEWLSSVQRQKAEPQNDFADSLVIY